MVPITPTIEDVMIAAINDAISKESPKFVMSPPKPLRLTSISAMMTPTSAHALASAMRSPAKMNGSECGIAMFRMTERSVAW